MSDVEIVQSNRLTKVDANFIRNQHEKYEEENGVLCNYTPFYFVAKNLGAIIGAVSGYTCYKEVYIDDILVHSMYRGQGVGRRLLEKVEEHFAPMDFNNINLVTNGFQAPLFYEKCGFQLEFVRKSRVNHKYDKYFYIKYF